MSYTLQSFNQAKRHSRRMRPGRLPGSDLTAIIMFLAMFLVFIFVLLPFCIRLIDNIRSIKNFSVIFFTKGFILSYQSQGE